MFILASFILYFQTKIYTSFHNVTALPAGHCSLSKRHRVKKRERLGVHGKATDSCVRLWPVSPCRLETSGCNRSTQITKICSGKTWFKDRENKHWMCCEICFPKLFSAFKCIKTHTFFYLSLIHRYAETTTSKRCLSNIVLTLNNLDQGDITPLWFFKTVLSMKHRFLFGRQRVTFSKWKMGRAPRANPYVCEE